MSKAEKFIQDCTRNCINTMQCYDENCNPQVIYKPWLTPDQARRAVEIAREETIEKIKQLFKENYLIKSAKPLRWISFEKVFNDLKQAMKDE